ncbi:efflux RND transporter periplasmic adaptor subunit [Massilia sp. TS11]|uniref:efflux RND transporter periplasmic adaptor subunit n=1 Tax=Massilia sp. TS11 TaxID=2908003 RepID=UPI001EDA18E3|nr:HlyD family efflux transporter periplasmic adaptor subunit [Massilia sp. TS11]MCG2584462.1 HlyD family efflux transporter periplasmic adaptor subunit [Massilia sp. TS11]
MSTPHTDVLAGLIQLGKRARDAASRAELGFVVVNETRQLIDYRQSVVWMRERGLMAVSGLPEPEANTPYGQWLEQLFAATGPLAVGEARTIDASALSGAVAQDWDDWLPLHALLLSLQRPGSDEQGIWLLARDEAWHEGEIDVLRELAATYGHAYRAFLPRPGWKAQLRKLKADKKRLRWIGGISAAVILFPVRLTVLTPAEVVPKDAFLVRAPLEGVVDRVHVKPNQAVKAGDPLFDLDTTGVRTRLGVASKAYEAAAEEYRQAAQMAVTDDEKGRLEMTLRKGRMEEKAAELQYSEQMLARVQVKASRPGTLVFSDVNDWVGRGVAVGERVMQIADPKRVEIAIRLPVADAIELDEHADVTLYLATAPQYSYKGQLSYASYRAEAGPDGIVAYRLKADFAPGTEAPRLGLTGTAKLHGAWVPTIYWVLRRPLAAARQWLGW